MPNHSPLPSCYLCLIPHFGGGIIRSGGNTKIIMIIDIVGTWCIGIPLCLLAAYVFKWGIVGVYTLLTTEELFRLAVSLIIFRRRKWIISLCRFTSFGILWWFSCQDKNLTYLSDSSNNNLTFSCTSCGNFKTVGPMSRKSTN